MAKATHYSVTDSFIGTLDDGREATYHAGETVEANDPGVRKWPQLFTALVVRELPDTKPAKPAEDKPEKPAAPAEPELEDEPDEEPPVEEATAEPGKKRTTRATGKAITTAGYKGR